ncbi:Kinase [Hexamita inflata]|uniref:non-specific serine/threonine protein kinase n=1 Tax=Hexamita inflata TaxID=28002 RepID=A0AA86N5A0_9EUKA|nr:Kinase [Hexamita inflata]
MTLLHNKYEYSMLKDDLGSGTYGSCYRAYNRLTQQYVALKIIPLKVDSNVNKIIQEAELLESLIHPHIAHGVEHFTDVVAGQNSLVIVMDFYELGSVRQFVNDNFDSILQIPLHTRQKWALQLTCALEFLHQNNLIHRDLKLENLFLSKDLNLFLGDFGIARSLEGSMAKTFLGTIETIAPEVLADEKYGTEADVWSLGCIWHELFGGEKAFTGAMGAIVLKIGSADYKRLQGGKFENSANEMMQKEREKRPSAEQIMKQYREEYQALLKGDAVYEEKITEEVHTDSNKFSFDTKKYDFRAMGLREETFHQGVQLAIRALDGEQVASSFQICGEIDFISDPVKALEQENVAMNILFKQLGINMSWEDAKRVAIKETFA